jgi:hypothetical protein
MELDFVAVVDIPAELARGCPSTAWNVGNVACHRWILGYYVRQVVLIQLVFLPDGEPYPCPAPQACAGAKIPGALVGVGGSSPPRPAHRRARLGRGVARNRVEEEGLALSLGALAGLVEDEASRCAGRETGGRGRLGGSERIKVKARMERVNG